MKNSLRLAIEDFLKEPRTSNGGWVEVTAKDMTKLEKVCTQLREAKCSRDPDGDIPIEFDLVNRCTHERRHWFQTQYLHKLKDDELPQEIKLRMVNLKMAMESLESAMRDDSIRTEFKKRK